MLAFYFHLSLSLYFQQTTKKMAGSKRSRNPKVRYPPEYDSSSSHSDSKQKSKGPTQAVRDDSWIIPGKKPKSDPMEEVSTC